MDVNTPVRTEQQEGALNSVIELSELQLLMIGGGVGEIVVG